MPHDAVVQEYWTEVSSSGVSLPIATHAGETNIQHFIDSHIIKNDIASSMITFKTGSRILAEADVGDATLINSVFLAGDIGASISAETNGSGTVSITGHSLKRK